MVFLTVTMLLTLLVAVSVTVYVAFPHRGEDVPSAPWLGRAMRRAADSLPRLEETEGREVQGLNELTRIRSRD